MPQLAQSHCMPRATMCASGSLVFPISHPSRHLQRFPSRNLQSHRRLLSKKKKWESPGLSRWSINRRLHAALNNHNHWSPKGSIHKVFQVDDLREWFFNKRTIILCSSIAWLAWCSRAKVALASSAASSVVVPATFAAKNAFVENLLKILQVLKEQGLFLSALLALSAFFSMAETSITTLWPWKVRELAEKEKEGGVFRLLRQDVTRFLTTILIGTTISNIAATALVTDAATTLFGEAGVTAATGVMTVVLLLLTEIAPKSIAVHNATQVARFVVRPVAWLSVVLFPVGRLVTVLSTTLLKLLGLKTTGEPFVTEEELKLMLRGAELSGAIEQEEQDMIENVLDIKDRYVHEVMTPLVNMTVIDASATGLEYLKRYLEHQYSRVPVFEHRVDNIVGIIYAMDILDYVQQPELLQQVTAGKIARRPVPYIPENMTVWNLLRLFRTKSVHMAVVCNEYGGAIGLVTLEDVVEEIVGEIFDENDSKEEIRRKTGYMVQRADGVFDVAASTTIEDLSDTFEVKFPEEHRYETVSGFVCEAFGYIPRPGDKIEVVFRKRESEERSEGEMEGANEEKKEKFQKYLLEVLAGNDKMVGVVRFTVLDDSQLEEARSLPPLPGFIRRAWKDQCDNESDKVDIIWDGKSIPCTTQNELCIPEGIEVVDAEITDLETSEDEEEEDELPRSSSADSYEKLIERRIQRRRKQALEAAEELEKANSQKMARNNNNNNNNSDHKQ